MKKLFYLVALILSTSALSAQTCLTLQPDGAAGKDANTESVSFNANTNEGNTIEFTCVRGTNNGDPDEVRGFIEFDLSSIPANATITSATFSVYANNTTVFGTPAGTSTYGTANAAYLKRITSPWGELTITGNNQPTFTTVDQVLLPQSTQANQDYSLNVTAFAQFWVQNPSQNYGMTLQIITPNTYNGHIFCSSDHPNASKRPKLVVCYTIPSCSAPSLTFSNTNPTSFGQNNGTIDITATSSCPSFTYSWTGPGGFTSSSEDLSNLAGGTYYVTVTNAGGNTTGSVTLTIPGSVPTLSEWGLIILSLLTISLVMVFMLGYQQALVPAGVSSTFTPMSVIRQTPFNKNLFLKVVTILLPVVMVGFLAVHYFIGTNGVLDFTGTMISTVIVSYMVHLLLDKRQ